MIWLFCGYLSAGQVSTFQLRAAGDQGVGYKISPVTTETEVNAMKCFQINGTKEDPVVPQAALPDLQGFEVSTLVFRNLLARSVF